MATGETAAEPLFGGSIKTSIDALLLVCLFGFITAISIQAKNIVEEDLWWHLRTGDWILAHGAVPLQDPFSTYTAGTPWIAYTWLFDVLTANVYAAWGLHGILALTAILVLTSVALLVRLLEGYVQPAHAVAIGAAAFAAMAPLIAPRPWLFTIPLFITVFWLLLRARDSGRTRYLLALPPLFALWANIHIQFVYGLAVVALFALESTAARLTKSRLIRPAAAPAWPLWAALGASVSSTLANPYGWRIYKVVTQYAANRAPLAFIDEMRPMSFRTVSEWIAVLLAGLALIAILRSRERVFPLILLAIAASLSLRTARDVWFLAVVSAALLGRYAASAGKGGSPWRLRWLLGSAGGLALAASVLGSPAVAEPALRAAVAKRFPEQAAGYLRAHDVRKPIYNSFDWGGYIMWRLPELPVSIDGRANLHGDRRLARAAAAWHGDPHWIEDPELSAAGTIILERNCALANILRRNSRFRTVYEDPVASIFQPRAAPPGWLPK